MRLDKYLSQCSIGTRNTARKIIYDGKITVNGEICRVPAFLVGTTDDIRHCEEKLEITLKYYLLNKPEGVITSKSQSEKTVFDCMNDVDTTSLFPVGRLDKNTEGLLIITNDGDFSNKLMSPDNHIKKTYEFVCIGEISDDQVQKLSSGIDIGYDEPTKSADIKIIKTGLLDNIVDESTKAKLHYNKKFHDKQCAFVGQISITEGKKHQVRRTFRSIGCPVVYLKRIAIGNIVIDDDLEIGKYKEFEINDFEF
ncbi:MAG: pseudouridine synthase [Clostridia bacterium]